MTDPGAVARLVEQWRKITGFAVAPHLRNGAVLAFQMCADELEAALAADRGAGPSEARAVSYAAVVDAINRHVPRGVLEPLLDELAALAPLPRAEPQEYCQTCGHYRHVSGDTVKFTPRAEGAPAPEERR